MVCSGPVEPEEESGLPRGRLDPKSSPPSPALQLSGPTCSDWPWGLHKRAEEVRGQLRFWPRLLSPLICGVGVKTPLPLA